MSAVDFIAFSACLFAFMKNTHKVEWVVCLSEGLWFDPGSSGLNVKVYLDKILKSKLFTMACMIS